MRELEKNLGLSKKASDAFDIAAQQDRIVSWTPAHDETVIRLSEKQQVDFEKLFALAEQIAERNAQGLASTVKIERAPGFALFGFLSTICSKKFVERELSALLADGNVQYQELLASGDTAGALRWKWSMRVAMLSTVLRGGLGALLGLVKIKAQSTE
jgi:hypothetical protein